MLAQSAERVGHLCLAHRQNETDGSNNSNNNEPFQWLSMAVGLNGVSSELQDLMINQKTCFRLTTQQLRKEANRRFSHNFTPDSPPKSTSKRNVIVEWLKNHPIRQECCVRIILSKLDRDLTRLSSRQPQEWNEAIHVEINRMQADRSHTNRTDDVQSQEIPYINLGAVRHSSVQVTPNFDLADIGLTAEEEVAKDAESVEGSEGMLKPAPIESAEKYMQRVQDEHIVLLAIGSPHEVDEALTDVAGISPTIERLRDEVTRRGCKLPPSDSQSKQVLIQILRQSPLSDPESLQFLSEQVSFFYQRQGVSQSRKMPKQECISSEAAFRNDSVGIVAGELLNMASLEPPNEIKNLCQRLIVLVVDDMVPVFPRDSSGVLFDAIRCAGVREDVIVVCLQALVELSRNTTNTKLMLEMEYSIETILQLMQDRPNHSAFHALSCQLLLRIASTEAGRTRIASRQGIQILLHSLIEHELGDSCDGAVYACQVLFWFRKADSRAKLLECIWLELAIESEVIYSQVMIEPVALMMRDKRADASVQALGCLAQLCLAFEGRDFHVQKNAIQSIVDAMRQHQSVIPLQAYACRALAGMAYYGDKENRDCIEQADGIRVVGAAINKHSSVSLVQRNACWALADSINQHRGNQDALREHDGFSWIFSAMKHHPHDEEVQKGACWALGYASNDNLDNQDEIGSNGGIPLILAAMDTLDSAEQECAIDAIGILLQHNNNMKRFEEANGPEIMRKYINKDQLKLRWGKLFDVVFS